MFDLSDSRRKRCFWTRNISVLFTDGRRENSGSNRLCAKLSVFFQQAYKEILSSAKNTGAKS